MQVAIYDNRLEISSPGGLMPGVTIEKMKEGFSKVRNHGIANAFVYMNLIEQWGSGIPKILTQTKEFRNAIDFLQEYVLHKTCDLL